MILTWTLLICVAANFVALVVMWRAAWLTGVILAGGVALWFALLFYLTLTL